MRTPAFAAALLLALAGTAPAQVARADGNAPPACSPGAGPNSANWGSAYREKMQAIFDKVKREAGVDPAIPLININDIKKENGSVRTVDGTPLAALPKGTQGLQNDAVIYTFGVFEIACDEQQMAFFLAHEFRHIKKVDGKNHFDRVSACRKQIVTQWVNSTDLTAYPDDKSAMEAFAKAKGDEVAKTCVLPVENEADAFAFDLVNKLYGASVNPNQDDRVKAFKNLAAWANAIGVGGTDPGHGTPEERAETARKKAADEAMKKHAALQEKLGMSLPQGFGE